MNYKYICIKNKQRQSPGSPEFILFRAKAKEINEWAAIERYSAERRDGPQRMSKPAKVSDVRRFLEKDERNTLSTALLVSLNVSDQCFKSISAEHDDVVSLEFSFDSQMNNEEKVVKPGMIVDGQHRLLGALKFDPNLLLNIVAMVNPSDDEVAFQFLVVNNKASRVSNNHLRSLALNYEEKDLGQRLREIRMSISQHLDFVGMVDSENDSPFFKIIDWPNNHVEGQPPGGFVAPSAIESSIAYIKQKRIPELEDDAILLGFFLAIWGVIKSTWPNVFNRDSHLLQKVSIVCLTQFITDNIAFEYDNESMDITDFKAVTEKVFKITEGINVMFWSATWAAKSLDTPTGRGIFLESLTQIRRNVNAGRAWYENVPIIDLQSQLL